MKRESNEDEAAYLALGADLAREYPGHLPLLAARVASLAALTGDKRAARLQVCGRLLWLHAPGLAACKSHERGFGCPSGAADCNGCSLLVAA